MWILLYVVAGLAFLVLALVIAGACLPVGHKASRSAFFGRPPEEVWAVVSDFASLPSWRTDLKEVERLADQDGRAVWRETYKNGQAIPYRIVESTAPKRLVGRIADPKLPFGGTWTWELVPADGGTRLTVTEDGEIYNLIFRALARFAFGYDGTVVRYLTDLEKRLSSPSHGIGSHLPGPGRRA